MGFQMLRSYVVRDPVLGFMFYIFAFLVTEGESRELRELGWGYKEEKEV